MAERGRVSVREMQKKDLPLVLDYWFKSDPQYLLGMGCDTDKFPTREDFSCLLQSEIEKPYSEKGSYLLVWELDGQPIGHSNVNQIEFGEFAFMHLHIWDEKARRRGYGIEFLKLSIEMFRKNLKLEAIFCEPYVDNPAPNRTLEKLGFRFVKRYQTTPGQLNFEQEVNRWVLKPIN